MKNILQLLEKSAQNYPNKTAFIDATKTLTFSQLEMLSKKCASALIKEKAYSKPIAIYIDKGVDVIIAMLGIVYSGNIYTVIDTEMPKERIEKIFSSLKPAAVISDKSHYETALELCEETYLIDYELTAEINERELADIRNTQIDTDPVYILYTSGSTGIPKGTVINHKNLLAYSEWAVNTFKFDESTVFGNQTPFYFSMSVTDIYSTLRAGSTLVIIPKICFSFPIKLVECLNNYKINTVYWVPSAFGIVANLKLFDIEKPEYLKTVLFAGEVMPVKYLNYWREHLDKDILYSNLFGPTETTDICTYYIVDRDFEASESLPIGKHCDNCNVFIVNKDGKKAKAGEEGELYVRGSFVAAGYYNNNEKTSEAFVQNPLNSAYPEICYKTGDLVKLNENGELIYICRKDFQIKRMGYRIELGEIEAAANSLNEVKECACIYSKSKNKIVLFYSANNISQSEMFKRLSGLLSGYMLPDEFINIPSLPRNQNGKTDRKELEKRFNDGECN
jgi:amino acid adenylation domain-containing protein